MAALSGCNTAGGSGQEVVDIKSDNRLLDDDPGAVPIVPETTKRLFELSDLIVYAEIVRVEGEPYERRDPKTGVEASEIFPEQRFEATFLWVLKGEMVLQDKTVSVIKVRSRYYLTKGQKRVLYLTKREGSYRTVDRFGGEHRLASALCDIRNLRTDAQEGGIIATFLDGNEHLCSKVHLLRGRHNKSLRINDKEWNKSLLRTDIVARFNICDIKLERGIYTLLLEMDGRLRSYTRLIDGYYPCVIIGQYRWWEPIYFDLRAISR